jgi:hypothetical protein
MSNLPTCGSGKSLSSRDRRQHFDEVLFSSHLESPDKIVSCGIMFHVNAKAGSTYVDLLTVCKRVGIKLDKARVGLNRLVAAGHWTVRKKDGSTYYIPRLRGDCILKSVSGDTEYYRWRGSMIDRTVADIRLTPAERVALLGILSQTWRDYSCTDSSRDIAKLVCVSQPIVAKVMSKRKQGENELKTSEATYAQSTGTFEANSGNSVNLLSVRTDRCDSVSHATLSEDSMEGKKRKGSGERGASPKAECFRLARETFGEASAAIIGKAIKDGAEPAEIREALEYTLSIESAVTSDLALALWIPVYLAIPRTPNFQIIR